MIYPCVESTAEFVANGLRVRVWRNEEADTKSIKSQYDNGDIRKIARGHTGDAASLALLLASQPRVNAVHVIDVQTDNGLVIYVEWP